MTNIFTVFVANLWPNDLQDTGQCQKWFYATNPLILVIRPKRLPSTKGQTDLHTQEESIYSPNTVAATIVIDHTAIHEKHDLYINSTLYPCISLESSYNYTWCIFIKFMGLWSNPIENEWFWYPALNTYEQKVCADDIESLSSAFYSQVNKYKCSWNWFKLERMTTNYISIILNILMVMEFVFFRIQANPFLPDSIENCLTFSRFDWNVPALVQIMAWRRPGDKPLSEPMMLISLTHICVTSLNELITFITWNTK